MNIAIIGRGDLLYNTMKNLLKKRFKLSLVITTKEAPEYKYKQKDYERFASKYNIPFFVNYNLDTLDQYITSHIDIAISVNFTNIISQKFIDRFPLGILNMHGGDLPKYRGNACQAWAILNKEKKVVLCIHKMIGNELDSGDIISSKSFQININTRIGHIYKKFEKHAPGLFVDALEKLKENPNYILKIQSKNKKNILRCYPRTPEDGRIFFNQSAKSILRLINASSEPYNGAFCEYNKHKFIIWRAVLENDKEKFLAIPGQVCKINNNGSIVVACKNSKIRILDIEYKGERIKPANLITSLRDRLR